MRWPEPSERRPGVRRVLNPYVVGPLLVGLIHVALVAVHYHVGSFDDDAGYILSAKALLAGHGLDGQVAGGQSIAGLYPPGYSALIAPLLWIWPHSFLPERLLSAACFAGIFPLTWIFLGRRSVHEKWRAAVLVLLALGPPLATFGSMVMAETPFVMVLLLLLLAVDRWMQEDGGGVVRAVAVAGSAAGLVWLKQAAIGLIAGLVLWLLLGPSASRVRVKVARALLVGGGVLLSLIPVAVARLSHGIPLAGARYSMELGTYYQGGLAHRLVDTLPSGLADLASAAVPAALVPYLAPLPTGGALGTVEEIVSWHVTVLALLGAAIWVRTQRDAAVPMVAAYLAESALWPFVNERRTILVIPLVTAWYVIGGMTGLGLARAGRVERVEPVERVERPGRRWASPPCSVASAARAVAAVVVLVPLVAQMPRDYLLGWRQNTSHFGGSRYAALLRHLGSPADVVETDYQSAATLFTGHVTAWSAFAATAHGCRTDAVTAGVAADRAAFLLDGFFNKPTVVDGRCVAFAVAGAPWAVELLHTGRDHGAVWELVGSGTAHPGMADLLQDARATATRQGSAWTVTWQLPAPAPAEQVSVGDAALDSTAAPAVTTSLLQVQTAEGEWRTVASAPAAVGDGPGRAPYLLALLPGRPQVTAVRLTLTAQGGGRDPGAVQPSVSDVRLIGWPTRS